MGKDFVARSRGSETMFRSSARSDPEREGGRSPGRSDARDNVDAVTLGVYLREMGEHPLLQSDEELELARQLDSARRGLTALARRVARSWRRRLDVEGPPSGKETWQLDRLGRFHDRLAALARSTENSGLQDLARRAQPLRRQLERAREALIVANLRLVVHIAKRYSKRGLPFPDLIQEGNLGLLKAVERFEHRRGNRFSTYAYWWIKQSIDRGLAEKGRSIRIPVHLIERRKKIGRAIGELRQLLGRRPSNGEIADRLGVPVNKVRDALEIVDEPLLLDDLTGDDDKPNPLENVADRRAERSFERAEASQVDERLHQSLRRLSPRQQRIIRLRFGIDDDVPRSLEDVGRLVGLSRERVRQLEVAGLERLQRSEALEELLTMKVGDRSMPRPRTGGATRSTRREPHDGAARSRS